MRIVVANANTTESVTRAVRAQAEEAAGPEVEILAVTPTRGIPRGPVEAAPAAPKARSSSSFMDRMNDRWDRRREGQ